MKNLPMQVLLAKILDFASVWALMRDSSILIIVWSPLAPIQVARRPYLAPVSSYNDKFTQMLKQKSQNDSLII